VEAKKSLPEDKMWDAAHKIVTMLVQEQQQIESNKDGIRSELNKIIAYLRTTISHNQDNIGENFFKYLKALVDNSTSIKRSEKTPDYYRSIQKICTQHLTAAIQSNPEAMLEVLGWASRLFIAATLENFGESAQTNRQIEIQTAAKSQSLQVRDEIEANITKISGNKVTYQLLNIFSKTVKEPKHYASLIIGQTVIVEITEIENGVPKKIKYIRHK
jgi:predicted thioesterase